ncbi:MAG: hypothetical protein AAGM04_00760 [Pseudomonadota bacterium]
MPTPFAGPRPVVPAVQDLSPFARVPVVWCVRTVPVRVMCGPIVRGQEAWCDPTDRVPVVWFVRIVLVRAVYDPTVHGQEAWCAPTDRVPVVLCARTVPVRAVCGPIAPVRAQQFGPIGPARTQTGPIVIRTNCGASVSANGDCNNNAALNKDALNVGVVRNKGEMPSSSGATSNAATANVSAGSNSNAVRNSKEGASSSVAPSSDGRPSNKDGLNSDVTLNVSAALGSSNNVVLNSKGARSSAAKLNSNKDDVHNNNAASNSAGKPNSKDGHNNAALNKDERNSGNKTVATGTTAAAPKLIGVKLSGGSPTQHARWRTVGSPSQQFRLPWRRKLPRWDLETGPMANCPCRRPGLFLRRIAYPQT